MPHSFIALAKLEILESILLLGRSKMVHNALMVIEIEMFFVLLLFYLSVFCTKAPRGCIMCLCAQNCLAVRRKKGTVPACSTEFSLLLKDAKLLNFNCGFTTTSFPQHLLALPIWQVKFSFHINASRIFSCFL